MTGVTRVAACLAGAALAVGLAGVGPVAPPPAAADLPGDLLAALLPQQTATAPQQARGAADYGHTAAPDGRLRRGCRAYPFRYRLTLPSDDWTLEVFLRDPRGRGLASRAFISDSDPAAQRSRFRFCRYSTQPGRFTIKALAHWYDDRGAGHEVWLAPSRFRLRAPR
jgi:hypothetical protein